MRLWSHLSSAGLKVSILSLCEGFRSGWLSVTVETLKENAKLISNMLGHWVVLKTFVLYNVFY